MERKTIKATITKDVTKLWSCESFKRITSDQYSGKLPKSSGEQVELYSPGVTPSPFCGAARAWEVAKEPNGMPVRGGGYMLCEHQLDGV